MYNTYSRLQQEHTQLHVRLCVSNALFPLFASKVNSSRRRRNVRPAAMAGSPLGVATHAPLWPWLHSEHLLVNNRCLLIFLSVPPAAFYSCTKKGQGCWRNGLCFALLTCEYSWTQRQTTALWGKYGSCLFYVVVAVLLSDFFRPSLISHAWRCLKDELHHGGKIWRLFLVMLWLLLLTFLRSQDHARTLCRNQHIHLEEVVCVCYRQDSCSSFIEYYQNINGTLLQLYKLLY